MAKKKPQDHQPKRTATRIVEVNGVQVALDPDVLDDIELLEDAAELQEGNGLKLVSVLRRICGDQYREVLDALRDSDTGRVSVRAASDFLVELLSGFNPNS